MSNRISFSEVPKGVFEGLMSGEKYVNETGISHKLLELIRFRASQLNGCAYCIDMHFKEAIAADEEPQRLYSASAFREAEFYTEQEKAILDWTEKLTLMSQQSDLDESFSVLSGFFSKEAIANITMAIIQINSWNRLAKSCGFPAGSYQPGGH